MQIATGFNGHFDRYGRPVRHAAKQDWTVGQIVPASPWHRAGELMRDHILVICEYCGGEGRLYRSCFVYERGCGFSHPDVEDDGKCPDCEGTGHALIEGDPITLDDFEDAFGP